MVEFDFAELCICLSWGAFSHFCCHEITLINSFIFAYMKSFLFGLSWHNHVKYYRLLVVVSSVSEETNFDVDTTSIVLSYLYYFGNVNKE